MLEGARLRSLKQLTEPDNPQQQPPEHHIRAAPAAVARAAAPPPAQQSQPCAPVQGASVKRAALPHNHTPAPAPPQQQSQSQSQRTSVTANSAASTAHAAARADACPTLPPSLDHKQQQQQPPPPTPPPTKAAATMRLSATGKHAAEVSGVYQATGERVNGYALYKRTDGP
jgi:hypothetical protein